MTNATSEIEMAIKNLESDAEALETWCANGDININNRKKMAAEIKLIIKSARQADDLVKENAKLREELRIQDDANDILTKRIEEYNSAARQAEVLRAALNFYADKNNWENGVCIEHCATGCAVTHDMFDEGCTAREALLAAEGGG